MIPLVAMAWMLTAVPAPAEEVGLPPGTKAPEFSLVDQAGQAQSLSGLLAEGPVAIVFFRSADW